MIRKFLSRRLTLVLVFGAAALAGSYGRLRGATETPAVPPALAAESKPAPAAVASRGVNLSSREEPSNSITPNKTASSASATVAKRHPDKLVAARVVVTSAAKPQLLLTGAHPRALKSAVPSKLRAMPMPAPQGGSGSPPNAPTLNSPADTGTGVSTSPTLSVKVTDPNSSNMTVNFYGKVVSSTPSGSKLHDHRIAGYAVLLGQPGKRQPGHLQCADAMDCEQPRVEEHCLRHGRGRRGSGRQQQRRLLRNGSTPTPR